MKNSVKKPKRLWSVLATNFSYKFKKTKNNIKESLHNKASRFKNWFITTGLYINRKDILFSVFEILITGLVLQYVLTHKNFLSYGAISFMIMYYIKWFVKLIKGASLAKTKEDVDEL